MADDIGDLIRIIRKANQELNTGTRLGYYLKFNDDKKRELIQILITVNIYGEPDLRRAEKFVNEYNLADNKYKLEFERNHTFFRGSQITSERPIFYFDVPLTKHEVNDATNTLTNLIEDFYNSL